MPYPYYNQPYQYYQNQYYQNPYQQAQMQNVQQQQMQQNAQQMQPVQQTQPQIQNGGFISVPNIETARNWPIAPGNSVTFKDESAPYIYTKTMGYNQLDTPRFERFRLVKEEEATQTASKAPVNASSEKSMDLSAYALKTDLDALQAQIEAIEKKLKGVPEGKHIKKEADSNDNA